MMEFDRPRMKALAKQAMKFQRPHPMLITLLYSILVSIGSQIISNVLGFASGSAGLSTLYLQALMDYEDPGLAIQYVLLSYAPERLALALFMGVFVAGIIASLWTGLMRTGYAGFCLGMVRGLQPQTGALFSAFPQCLGILITQFLAGLFRMLWGLLFGVAAAILFVVIAMLFSDWIGVALVLMLAVYIALIAAVVWVTLRYALVDFVIADQGVTGLDAIRESKQLMRGNTGRLFTLELSFIGWYLLEAAVFLVIFIAAMGIFGVSLFAGDGFAYAAQMAAGGLLAFFGLTVIAVIAIGVFNLWLTPYITGTEALFYDWTRGVNSPPAMGGYGGYGGYGGGQGGWGQPYPPQQNTGYSWTPTPGPSSGTGIGSGPQGGYQPPRQPGGYPPPQQPGGYPPSQQPPKSPKDDPWG